jgi:hypothetical protein
MSLAHHQNCLLEKNMPRPLKALPLALALATLIVFAAFLASCSSTNTSQARFVNAVSDSQNMDIAFNGTKKIFNVPVNQANASTYISVPAGSVAVEGFAAGSNTVAFQSQTVTLNSGKQYTLAAAGKIAGSVTVLNFVDTNTAPANGTVNFRVINSSSDGPSGGGQAVDVYILPNPVTCTLGTTNCTPAVTNLGFGSASNYVPISFNSGGSGWQMIVTVTGSTSPYFNDTLGNVGSTTVGAVCTLVLTDTQGGAQMNISPLKLNDLNCGTL